MSFSLSCGWAQTPAPAQKDGSAQTSQQAPPAAPDDHAVEEFSRSVTRGGKEKTQEKTDVHASPQEMRRHDTADAENPRRGEALLAMLGHMHGTVQPEQAPCAAAASMYNPLAAIDSIVCSIQLNLPAAGQRDTVRLDIDPALLPDTAIIIQRTEDGGLSVRISTANAASEYLLFQQADRLSSALNRLNAGAAQLEINGHAAGQEGSQDGRSRNREVTEEAAWRQLRHT